MWQGESQKGTEGTFKLGEFEKVEFTKEIFPVAWPGWRRTIMDGAGTGVAHP